MQGAFLRTKNVLPRDRRTYTSLLEPFLSQSRRSHARGTGLSATLPQPTGAHFHVSGASSSLVAPSSVLEASSSACDALLCVRDALLGFPDALLSARGVPLSSTGAQRRSPRFLSPRRALLRVRGARALRKRPTSSLEAPSSAPPTGAQPRPCLRQRHPVTL